MSDRQDHVDATLGSRQIRFELRRDAKTAQMLALCHLAPFATYRRFGEGLWLADDIIRILSLASPKPHICQPWIAQRVRGGAYGLYAPLALAVLEAHLFGIATDRAIAFEDPRP